MGTQSGLGNWPADLFHGSHFIRCSKTWTLKRCQAMELMITSEQPMTNGDDIMESA